MSLFYLVTWAAYVLAIVLVVLVKMLGWMHGENPQFVTFKASLLNYFIGGSAAKFSSITILAFELLLGAVYVDRFPIPGLGWVASIPLHPIFSFFLGSISEIIAPPGIRWISKRIFPD